MEYCLITDIGGTNSSLFLFEMDRRDVSVRSLIHLKRYATLEFTDIYQVFDRSLAGALQTKSCHILQHRDRRGGSKQQSSKDRQIQMEDR